MIRKQFIAQVKKFISENDLELQHAVFLLGGSSALMRLHRLRRALAVSNNKNVHFALEVNWLYELLSLEHVSDIDRAEFGHFAMIHPGNPAVWTICGLTEAVGAVIEDSRAPDQTVDQQSGRNGEVAA